MDFSDYLRRKRGQAVYANYHAQESVNSTACLVSPTNLSCSSQIKPKSFADAYDIAQGSSTSGCGYSISENGVFSYVPKCAPSAYTNITGNVNTEYTSQTTIGFYMNYSSAGTPQYAFPYTAYIQNSLYPRSTIQGSLYTVTNVFGSLKQYNSNWLPTDIQPISAVTNGCTLTSWSTGIEPLKMVQFDTGISPGGVTNKYLNASSSENVYCVNWANGPNMYIYSNASVIQTIPNINASNIAMNLTKLDSNLNYQWTVGFDSHSLQTTNIDPWDFSYMQNYTNSNDNSFIAYKFDRAYTNTFYNSGSSIVTAPGILFNDKTKSGVYLLNYDINGNATWVATIVNNTGRLNLITGTPTGNVYVTARYSSNITNGPVVFYNSNGTTSNVPPLQASTQGQQYYIASYTNAGAFAWASTFAPASSSSSIEDIKVDSSSNVYIGGYYTASNIYYDASGSSGAGIQNVSTAYPAAFIGKYNSSGTPQWALSFTVNSPNLIFSQNISKVSTDPNGNIYAILITGTCNARIYKNNTLVNGLYLSNLGPGFLNALVKINSSGDIQWINPLQEPYYGTDIPVNLTTLSYNAASDSVVVGGTANSNVLGYNSSGVLAYSNSF